MKKVLAAALAATMIIGLGTGYQAPALGTAQAAQETAPAAEAAAQTAAQTVLQAVQSATKAVDGSSFDEAIEDLYTRSAELSDEDVMEAAQGMESDLSAARSVLGSSYNAVKNCLDLFEEAKAQYLSGETAEAGAYEAEWARQASYAAKLFSDEQTICSIVPRYRVDEAKRDGDQFKLDIYEWVTVGYKEDGSDALNTSAFGYTYSVALGKSGNGAYSVTKISGSDENFRWMSAEAEQAAQQAAAENTDSILEMFAEDFTALEAHAAETVTILPYTYSRDKAIAYADQWCLKRNRAQYSDYSNVGGDCANFVSQCLAAGGMPVNGSTFYDGWHKNSLSWINVMAQIKHFKNYGTYMIATKENTLKGNPVYFDWNGDGTWDHATICVGKNASGTPIIDSHTADLYHATWSYDSAKNRCTIQLFDSSQAAQKAVKTLTVSDGKNGDSTTVTTTTTTTETTTTTTTQAKNGWKKSGKNWFYYENNKKATGWNTIDGKKYYMNASGVMQTGWEQVDGKWYYLDPQNGDMKTGWIQLKGKWYWLDEKTGAMATGWVKVKNKWYYMNTSSGAMRTGWITVKGSKYYLNKSGAMVTGRQKIGGKWYTFASSGRLKKKG